MIANDCSIQLCLIDSCTQSNKTLLPPKHALHPTRQHINQTAPSATMQGYTLGRLPAWLWPQNPRYYVHVNFPYKLRPAVYWLLLSNFEREVPHSNLRPSIDCLTDVLHRVCVCVSLNDVVTCSNVDDRWPISVEHWRNDTYKRESQYVGRNWSQRQCVHHEFHTEEPGIEPVTPRWQAGD